MLAVRLNTNHVNPAYLTNRLGAFSHMSETKHGPIVFGDGLILATTRAQLKTPELS
jgi:hypothetical protein